MRIKLSASVPPEVKMISLAVTFKIFAISFRAFSSNDFDDLPYECVDEGFPYSVFRTSVMQFITSSLSFVVAALSKYTFFIFRINLLTLEDYNSIKKKSAE